MCEQTRVAEERYKAACQRATAVYEALVKKAYETHLKELDAAKFEVEAVPYSHKSRNHHHRHHY